MIRPFVRRAGFALAAIAGLGAVPAARDASAAGDPTIEALIAAKAPAVVSVKFVLKIHLSRGGQSQDSEGNSEIRGTVVDPSGLVMVGNDSLEGGLPRRVITAFRRGGGEVTMSPTDLKVLFGNESKEYDAAIVARDSNLGLCFLQIVDPEAKVPASIDLSKGVEGGVGQPVFTVTRKPRGYDCAPVFGRLFVSGRVEKPRPMLAVAGTAAHSGFPAYDAAGGVVGVISAQSGSEGVEDTSSESFILPLETVRNVIDQVKKRVPEVLQKAKAAKDAAKEGTKEEPKETPKEPAMGETPPADQPK